MGITEATNGSGQAQTITSWVRSYSDSLFSWAYYKIGIKETAEDLVQETFMAAYQSIEGFDGRSSPKTWLFSILHNKIADHYRQNLRSPVIDGSRLGAADALFHTLFDGNGKWIKEQRPAEWPNEADQLLDSMEFNQALESCLGKLPENWLLAVRLKYLEEKKGNLICQELDISATNFWQILHRAKLQLRKCLEINWFKR